jgi:hypothetical protein
MDVYSWVKNYKIAKIINGILLLKVLSEKEKENKDLQNQQE